MCKWLIGGTNGVTTGVTTSVTIGLTIGVTIGLHAHTCQVDFELPDEELSLNRTRHSGTSKARSRGSTGNAEMKLKLMIDQNGRPNLEKQATALNKHKNPSCRPLTLRQKTAATLGVL